MGSLWQYRRFIWATAVSDLRHRYAGSGLGVFWNVVQPLAMLVILTFVFTNVLAPRFGTATLAAGLFPFYLGSGFLLWAAFADCVTRGAQAFVTNAEYLKKMPIPEHVFVAQTAVSSTLGMLIAVALLLGLTLLFGLPAHWTWLLLPLVAVLWQGFGFGLGLALSTLNAFFRDVGQIVGVVLQIWMWSLPIVYFEDVLPDAYRSVLPYNPAYPFLRAIRDVYLYAELPPAWIWVTMLGWVLAATALGYALLASLRAEIRDVL